MIKSATDIIRGLYEGAKGSSNYFKPLFKKGMDLVSKAPQLMSRVPDLITRAPEFIEKLETARDIYSPYVNDFVQLYQGIRAPHDISPVTITPSQNAAYGVGNLGVREPASMFIGDDQDQIEHDDRILRNPNGFILQGRPAPKQLVKKNFPQPENRVKTERDQIKQEIMKEMELAKAERRFNKSKEIKGTPLVNPNEVTGVHPQPKKIKKTKAKPKKKKYKLAI